MWPFISGLAGGILLAWAVGLVFLKIAAPAWRDFQHCREPHLPPTPLVGDLNERLEKHRAPNS